MLPIRTLLRYSFLPILILFSGYLFAQSADSLAAAADSQALSVFRYLHQQEEALPVTLRIDMRAMYRQKIRIRDHLPAEFSFASADGTEQTWEIKAKARGNVRRQICAFPPLKLKFPKKMLRELGMDAKHNDLKLVTHCKSGDIGSQKVLREYLAYRIYNILTDNSFRAQLIELTYEDTQGKRKTVTEYGMLLEDIDELADRIGGDKCSDCAFTNPARFSLEEYRLFCVFQYLIGNTDFSIKDLHNLKVVEIEPDETYLPIPYDFDYAGLVDASYAVPHESLPIDKVTERYFMGLRFPCELYDSSLQLVQEKRAEIFELVEGLSSLDDRDRADVKHYLEGFFDLIENPGATARAFNCVVREE